MRGLGGVLIFLGALGAVSSAQAWTLESRGPRPGDPPSCLIRADKYGVAVTHYRWAVGEPTTLLSVGAAKANGPLEVTVDGYGPVSGRAADRRVWSRPDLIDAMLAGSKMKAAWTSHQGDPTRAEIDLEGFAEAYAACKKALDAIKQP